jgi:folate-binding protein YgfZ
MKPLDKAVTLFTNEKGRIIDRTHVLVTDNGCLLVGNGCEKNKLFSWINRYIITEDIITTCASNDYSLIEVLGEQSTGFLSLLFADKFLELSDDNYITFEIDGEINYLFKDSYNGNTFSHLILSSRDSESVINYLNENKSFYETAIIPDLIYKSYRIEKGIPKQPFEINDSINPHENGLISDVSFNKGCYIGQEVIARLDTYDKVQRVLKGIVLEKEINPELPAIIFSINDEEIGIITSIVYSEMFKKQIGLAIIRKKYLENDTEYFITIGDERIKLIITDLPFNYENIY